MVYVLLPLFSLTRSSLIYKIGLLSVDGNCFCADVGVISLEEQLIAATWLERRPLRVLSSGPSQRTGDAKINGLSRCIEFDKK
jgi:hypothetical protein